MLLILCGCSEYYYDVPNMEDTLNDICKPTDGYLLRRDYAKTYILAGAKDNLNSSDIAMFDIGLYCLGYQPVTVEPFVYFDQMKDLVQQPVDLFYFSGHGAESGAVLTSDESFYYIQEDVRYAATNIFFNSCKVLKNPDAIKRMIDTTVEYVMGYSEIAYDDVDNTVVLDMLKFMKKGNSIPMSFYLANKDNADLKDRWVIYQNSPREFYEYSARSTNDYTE